MVYLVSNDLFSEVPKATISDVVEFCKDKDILGLDIETSRLYKKNLYPEDVYQPGLDPYLSRVVMLQIGDIETRFVIDTRTTDISELKPILEDKTKTFVTWNGKFEYKHILHSFGIKLANIYDGMLVEIILTNGLQVGYSLLEASKRYLNVKDAKDITLFTADAYNEALEDKIEYEFTRWDKMYIDKSTRLGFLNIEDKPFTVQQILYGADDIELPLLIREKQLQVDWFPKQCAALENEFCLVLGDVELRGTAFDKQAWLKVYDEYSFPGFIKSKGWLDEYVINNYPQFTSSGDLFSGAGACAIEWSSSKQVIQFFKFLGICPKEKSKQTGRVDWTVGAKAMQKILNNKDHQNFHELVKKYIEFKEFEQACTTFGKDWLKYVHPITHRVHSTYRQIMHTGRLSSTRPNLTNISNGDWRKAFVASKGFKIIDADYSSQEVVVLANKSGDENMCEMLLSGNDPHCFTATNMYRIKLRDSALLVTKESAGKGDLGKQDPSFRPEHATMRQNAKTVSFAVPYGAGPFTLKEQLNSSEEEAQEIIDLYYETFPGVKAFFDAVGKEDFKRGWIEIDKITKRRYFYPKWQEMLDARDEVYKILPDNYNTLPAEQKQAIKLKYKPKTSPLWKKFFTLRGELQRKSQNYRIQGESGSITKLAAILLRREIIAKNLQDSVFIINLVHDEVIVECVESLAEYGAKLTEDKMVEAGAYWCKLVPLKAKATITSFWEHD